jgi:hypothetical protein
LLLLLPWNLSVTPIAHPTHRFLPATDLGFHGISYIEIEMWKFLALCGLTFVGQAPQPSAENVSQWLAFIRPKPAEVAFESNDWKATFWEAVVEAQQKQKPILLWAMNGHPMACT